jgi:hypothetical protein
LTYTGVLSTTENYNASKRTIIDPDQEGKIIISPEAF